MGTALCSVSGFIGFMSATNSASILVNPLVEFVVIINPDSGPGSPSPDASYLAELQKLCNFRNVLTLGYVRTDYCRRPLVDVCGEISTYASWEEVGVPVSGIFFDETPNEYTPKAHAYLRAVSAMVKAVPGIQVPELVSFMAGKRRRSKLRTTAGGSQSRLCYGCRAQ